MLLMVIWRLVVAAVCATAQLFLIFNVLSSPPCNDYQPRLTDTPIASICSDCAASSLESRVAHLLNHPQAQLCTVWMSTTYAHSQTSPWTRFTQFSALQSTPSAAQVRARTLRSAIEWPSRTDSPHLRRSIPA